MCMCVVQFEFEFRRFGVDRSQTTQFAELYGFVKDSYHLPAEMPFTISYTDPRNGDLLPINNNDNMLRAFSTSQPLLRLIVYREQGIIMTLELCIRLILGLVKSLYAIYFQCKIVYHLY